MSQDERKIDYFKEHEIIRNMVHKFATEELEPSAMERNDKEYFDQKLFKRLGELGLLGITAPEEFGGSGQDALAVVVVHEELSSVDPGFCLSFLAHSLLTVNNLSQNANSEQKKRYLPKLCDGSFIGAMAMSETHAGTDVQGMTTRAQRVDNGYIINGKKMWITNGARDEQENPADVLFLYAKVGDKISSFVVEGGQEGYRVGQKLKKKLGMRSSLTAEIVLDNCFIRDDQLIGQEGDSLKHMMRNLEIERLGLSAMALGIARRSLSIMVAYANERKAFGQKIADFGQIQRYIAESYAKYKACRAYVYQTAASNRLDGYNGRIDSDAVKLISSQIAKEIADCAIQILGGNGYMGEYVVERLWRDAKLLEIGGGTIEAHHKNITCDLIKNMGAILV